MSTKLTDIAIRKAKAGDNPYKLFDGGGLFLLVSKNRAKGWRLKYRFEGKEKLISLGTYPEVSLAQARAIAAAMKAEVLSGIDPSQARKSKKAAAREEEAAKEHTFEVVAREYLEAHRGRMKNKKYAAATVRRLENYIFPYLGTRAISELGAPDYLVCLHKIEETGHITTARIVAQLCGQVTRFALRSGYVQSDAASGLTEVLKTHEVRHHPCITDPKKLGILLCDIEDYSGSPSTLFALRMMPYVFVRSGELRGARWSEFDLKNAIWKIPAERMKMKRVHEVPLSRQVLKLLQELRTVSGGSDWLFPSRTVAGYITDEGLYRALIKLGYKGKTDVHGFRGTASTLLNEGGYRPDLIEIQLAHKCRDAVRDAYNHARWMPERAAMMQEWANYLDKLRDEARHSVRAGVAANQ